MKPFTRAYIVLTIVVSALVLMAGCAKPDRSEEAKKLKQELQEQLFKNPEQALMRVDSAEQAGVFTPATANIIRTNLYGQMGQTRLAIYYGEKILNVPELKREGDTYYSAVLLLNGLLTRNGEYGKVLRLCDELIADVDNERAQGGGISGISEQVACRVKSRALTFKGDCEHYLGHNDEAERYYLKSIDMMMDGVKHPDDYWVIDALFTGIIETTEFYLELGEAEKALPMVAKGDTALVRLDHCPNVPDYIHNVRHNNITIGQAMVYAANGQRDKAEALYLKHRQAKNPSVYDIGGDARYLAMTGRYNEAIRMFGKVDSLYKARGGAINTTYIQHYMMNQYDALQKAGRMDEVRAMADRMRHLTDSIHLQERKIDVEQVQEIQQKEAEIASRRQSLAIHRIIIIAAIIILLLVGYLLVRAYIYNKALEAKNRSLYQEIQQREKARADEHEALQAQPAETLSQNQQLYIKLCQLMSNPDLFTDPDTNQDTLASLAGTNRTYIYDALHECAGVTPADFINGYRLRYAAGLLSTTNDSIALIAELCGLSRRTFYRLFDEAYAMSPSEYRKVAKK